MTEEHLLRLMDSFTQGGTPLPALVGSKHEWQVTVLVAGLIANPNVSASLEPVQVVDAAITYINLIQERLGAYNQAKLHSLEKLLDT